MNKNTIVHVDLGGSRISALAGMVLESGALKILGEQSRTSDDVKCGIVEKMTGAAYKINETTKLLHNALHIDAVTSVSISLNAKSMKHFPYSVKEPIRKPITEEYLKELQKGSRNNVKTDTMDVIESIPLAYYIDGQRIIDPVGHKGSNLRADYNMIVCNQIVKENIERSIERTGLAVDYIHLGAEAMATAILDEDDRERGCAIIAFGATTTTLAVYCEGVLQELLVVPLGGYNITKDIQELGISFNNAELLKCKTGSALERLVAKPVNVKIPSADPNGEPVLISTQFLATIIESRLAEILDPILDHLDQIAYPLQAGIVITGGAAKLNNLIDFLVEKTGFPVRKGSHAEWLTDDTDPKFHDPSYSQTVGAILLTNELREDELAMSAKAIKPKIPSNGIFTKLGKKLNDGVQKLFEYDEIEKEKNT